MNTIWCHLEPWCALQVPVIKIGVPGEFHEDWWQRTEEDSERLVDPAHTGSGHPFGQKSFLHLAKISSGVWPIVPDAKSRRFRADTNLYVMLFFSMFIWSIPLYIHHYLNINLDIMMKSLHYNRHYLGWIVHIMTLDNLEQCPTSSADAGFYLTDIWLKS